MFKCDNCGIAFEETGSKEVKDEYIAGGIGFVDCCPECGSEEFGFDDRDEDDYDDDWYDDWYDEDYVDCDDYDGMECDIDED